MRAFLCKALSKLPSELKEEYHDDLEEMQFILSEMFKEEPLFMFA